MTNDDRTGAFWERHDKLMQDPEHEARFNTELARIRAVDAQVNADDTLRTALTKLAEDWPGGFGEALRALLAAHPAPSAPTVAEYEAAYPDGITRERPVSDTRREDVGLEHRYVVGRLSDPTGKHATCRYFVLDPQHDSHAVTALRAYSAAVRSERPELADDLDAWVGAPVSDTRREDVARALFIADADGQSEAFLREVWDRAPSNSAPRLYWYQLALAVLAVLPAPPVVDEAQIQDIVRDAYDTHIDLGSPARRGEFVFTAAEVIAARLRGATR